MPVIGTPIPAAPEGADHRPAKWYVSTAPEPLFTAAELAAWLRIDNPTADDDALLLELAAAAVDYAEDRTAGALMVRTIVATYYHGETVRLPRTPLVDVQSVTGADGAVVTDYTIDHAGHAAFLRINAGYEAPLTVVYRAGYETAAAVPASIRQAVRAHVGTLWELRESVSPRDMKAVPHSLDAFFRLKSRSTGVA